MTDEHHQHLRLDLHLHVEGPIHIHLHGEQDSGGMLDQIVKRLTIMEKRIMASLDDIIASEDSESTALAVLATALQSLIESQAALQKQIADLLDGVSLPPAVQAKVDAALGKSAANVQAVKDEIAKIASPTP